MREDICSIPVIDVFQPKSGCPFCRMRDMLEDRIATYITGAAMMEPDVRLETNRAGFCETHFSQILARGSKLSIGLIMESLVAQVHEDIFGKKCLAPKKLRAAVDTRLKSCFICENVNKNMEHITESMLKLWQGQEEFRELYASQEYICLPHFGFVMARAQGGLPKKSLSLFAEDSQRLSEGYLAQLGNDVTHFCRMFDYRNQKEDWGNSKDASERAIAYLTGRIPTEENNSGEKNR